MGYTNMNNEEVVFFLSSSTNIWVQYTERKKNA